MKTAAISHEEQFERRLMRHGVGELAADRRQCEDCGRTPLVGEYAHLYASKRRTVWVCELCRTLRREEPTSTELVRHSERGLVLRVVAKAA